jgi:predicted nucleic acid-binding protein
MSILVDSSVWIAYFRGTSALPELEWLIDENLITTNDLVLAELIPYLLIRKRQRLISLMSEINRLPLAIDWADIIQMQTICLRRGINAVGIPDLIMAEHAIQNHLALFSLDEHFTLMSKYLPLSIYESGK